MKVTFKTIEELKKEGFTIKSLSEYPGDGCDSFVAVSDTDGVIHWEGPVDHFGQTYEVDQVYPDSPDPDDRSLWVTKDNLYVCNTESVIYIIK